MKHESQVATKQKPSWLTENLKFLWTLSGFLKWRFFKSVQSLSHRNGSGGSRFFILNNLSAVIMLTATIPSVIRFHDARLIDPTGSFKKKILLPGRPLRPATWAHPGLENHSTCEVRCEWQVSCCALCNALQFLHCTLLFRLFVKAATSVSCHLLGPQALCHSTRSPLLSHPIASSLLLDACRSLFVSLCLRSTC